MNREERDAAFGNFTAALEVHLVRFRKQLAAKYGIQPRTSDRRLPRAEKEKEDRARLAELDLQIASCIRLEREFQETLVADEAGRKVFTTFLKELAASGKTAAHARQYFRERAIVFNRFVVPEVKRGAWMGVNKFSLNWNFVLWVLSRCKIPPAIATYLRKIHIPTAVGAPLITSPDLVAHLATLTLAIFKHRDDVAVQNLPLVIDRAKAFGRCTQRAENTDLDFVDVAVEGIIMALDKTMVECVPRSHWNSHEWHPVAGVAYWRGHSDSAVGDFMFPRWVASGYRVDKNHTADKHVSSVERPATPGGIFRTTAIGRMGGRLINSYSLTHLHLGPNDKKVLYHANKRSAGHLIADGVDYQSLSDHIRRDRIAWLLARAFTLDPRDVEVEVDIAYEIAVKDEENRWKSLGTILSEKYEDAHLLVEGTSDSATPEEIARVMLASSVVPTVDDEGEDRQERDAPYAAPESSRPDVQFERAEQEHRMEMALRALSIFDRKVLVLSGLASLSCLETKGN